MINEPGSPNPDNAPLEYAVGCEDCERIKDLGRVPCTVPLVRSQYSAGALVCQECEEERGRVDTLFDIGYLILRVRELGWEDVAELVIRRKLAPADRLFRRLEEFVADEVAAQYYRSREKPDSIASEIPSLPRDPGSSLERFGT